MNYQDIITEARGIVQETDPNNSHATDATLLGWANACTLQLFSLLGTYPKASIPGIVAADTITLPVSLLRLDSAAIADASGNYQDLATVDFNNFNRENRGWRNTQDGQPQMLVRLNDTQWMMYPNPDANWVGKSLSLYGSVLPTPDTDVNASPPINQSIHCAYPHYVAWKFFLLLNNPERAQTEFLLYDGLRSINTGTATSTNGTLKRLRMAP